MRAASDAARREKLENDQADAESGPKGDRPLAGHIEGRNARALNNRVRIRLLRDRHKVLHILGGIRADDRSIGDGADAVFQEILVGPGLNLAEVVDHGLVLGAGADFLERGYGHGGQEADDDHDDHDFYEGETLVGLFHMLAGFDVITNDEQCPNRAHL